MNIDFKITHIQCSNLNLFMDFVVWAQMMFLLHNSYCDSKALFLSLISTPPTMFPITDTGSVHYDLFLFRRKMS